MPNSVTLKQRITLFKEYSREIEAARSDSSMSWDETYELIAMLKKERSDLLCDDVEAEAA